MNIFLDKNRFTGLNAIDGKKWVKFVVMRQNSATKIYDLNTIKSAAGSCH